MRNRSVAGDLSTSPAPAFQTIRLQQTNSWRVTVAAQHQILTPTTATLPTAEGHAEMHYDHRHWAAEQAPMRA